MQTLFDCSIQNTISAYILASSLRQSLSSLELKLTEGRFDLLDLAAPVKIDLVLLAVLPVMIDLEFVQAKSSKSLKMFEKRFQALSTFLSL